MAKFNAKATAALKVGLVLDDSLDKPDGIQQYILCLGEWLRTQGHDVHYLVGQSSRSDVANVHSLSRNVNVRFNGNRMSVPLPVSRTKLRNFLAAEKFDVLHVQVPYSPWLAQPIIQFAGPEAAVIGTFHVAPHSPVMTLGSRALAILSLPSLGHFNVMLSVSKAAQAFAKKTYGLDTEVVPNMVDYQRFAKAKPIKKYDDTRLTILFLGRLVPRKGCKLLLQAVVDLLTQTGVPEFRVLICGKGPLEAELRQYCIDNNINDVVEFIGFVSEADKPNYYASADISVFPSSGGESFGIVLIEALASKKGMVLAGNNEGYRTVMEPQPELLFDPKNSAALAEKLRLYLLNTKQRRAMAQWGVKYSQLFDTATVGTKILQRYKQALASIRSIA